MSDQKSVFNKTFRWVGAPLTVLNAPVAVVGAGTNSDVRQFVNIGVMIATVGFTGVIKMAGSFTDFDSSGLNFGAGASESNPWGFVGMFNYDTGAFVAGSTGLVLAGDTAVRLFTMNTQDIHTLNSILSGALAGQAHVFLFPVNNQ